MNCLQQARSIVEKKNPVPILANILIDATLENNSIDVTATDLEVSLIKSVALVDKKHPGKIAGNFLKLAEIVGALSPSADITMEADEKKDVWLSKVDDLTLSYQPCLWMIFQKSMRSIYQINFSLMRPC